MNSRDVLADEPRGEAMSSGLAASVMVLSRCLPCSEVGEGMMRRTLAAVPPASGAVVMATGIVSIDSSSAGRETLSRVLLGLGTALGLVLGALLVARTLLVRTRPGAMPRRRPR
jgi:hypothetical protein